MWFESVDKQMPSVCVCVDGRWQKLGGGNSDLVWCNRVGFMTRGGEDEEEEEEEAWTI